MIATNTMHDLRCRYPEWTPWLAVVEQVLDDIQRTDGDAAVPDRPAAPACGAPLLARAALASNNRVGPLFETLRRSAVRSGSPTMAGLQAVARTQGDACTIFQAALNCDAACLGELAAAADADPEALRAVAALLPMPFLHACRRCWAHAMPQDWSAGYCPCCGAWPAFAETCGIERSRYLRCGRCGCAWRVTCLACPYCGTTDHRELASMVPEQGASRSAIEVCKRCMGYVKVATSLQPSPPATVMLDDLASVELDLAATQRGYVRPHGVGYVLGVTVAGEGAPGPCVRT